MIRERLAAIREQLAAIREHLAALSRLIARHPLAAACIAVPVALVAGALTGVAVGRAGASPTPHQAQRLAQVRADLARIDGDYLLATGDSHIAYWPVGTLCGLPVVNAGVTGATTRETARFIEDLPLWRAPRAVILTVGTNDANIKRFRRADDAMERFAAAFDALLAMVTARADMVVVTGPPPIDEAAAPNFSAEVAARIGAAEEAACRAMSDCRVLQPFPKDVALDDGVHLRDYARAYDSIEPALCAELDKDARRLTASR